MLPDTKFRKICLFLINYFESKTGKNISKNDLETLSMWMNNDQESNEKPFSMKNASQAIGLNYEQVRAIFEERIAEKTDRMVDRTNEPNKFEHDNGTN